MNSCTAFTIGWMIFTWHSRKKFHVKRIIKSSAKTKKTNKKTPRILPPFRVTKLIQEKMYIVKPSKTEFSKQFDLRMLWHLNRVLCNKLQSIPNTYRLVYHFNIVLYIQTTMADFPASIFSKLEVLYHLCHSSFST